MRICPQVHVDEFVVGVDVPGAVVMINLRVAAGVDTGFWYHEVVKGSSGFSTPPCDVGCFGV